MLKTAVEIDRRSLNEEVSHGSKSIFTSSSISPYKRSVSPDTMLQGVTSNTSISVSAEQKASPSSFLISFRMTASLLLDRIRIAYNETYEPMHSERTISFSSDHSSNLSFFGMKNIIVGRKSSDILVQYWWDLTPENIHTIVINYLYDSDNRWCNQCWTFLEKKLGISRLIAFYMLTGVFCFYILSGDLAKLIYYIMGIGYPMFKTHATYESRGLSACRSWLRYWIVFGWLAMLDVFFHHYLKNWTAYWSIKIIITIYLLLPLIKGADLIYRDFIKSFTKNIEKSIQFVMRK